MEINEIIKQRRMDLGLTMKAVADRVGVTEATVSRWESGDIANMRRDKIYALSKVLGISPMVILGYEQKNEERHRYAELIDRLDRMSETSRAKAYNLFIEMIDTFSKYEQ